MAARLRKGDQVLVIAGRSKGHRGEILEIIVKDDKALVKGAALVKHHRKPDAMGENGGIVQKESPIHLSNLKLIDPNSDKATKVGFKKLEDGKKVRFAKISGDVINDR